MEGLDAGLWGKKGYLTTTQLFLRTNLLKFGERLFKIFKPFRVHARPCEPLEPQRIFRIRQSRTLCFGSS